MNKLKTLKDLSHPCLLRGEKCCVPDYVKGLKQLVIKWVKKDKEDIQEENSIITPIYLLRKWMRRLNITEKDLK